MKQSILIVLLILQVVGHGQQDVQFTNFEFNQSYNNPANISSTNYYCGNLIARNQWNQFGGNPNTAFLNVYTKLDNHNYVGLQFLTDEIGFQQSNLIKFSYAYKLITSVASVTFGLSGNMHHSRWGAKYITPDTPEAFDDAIPHNGYGATKLDMDFGILIENGPLYVGLSSTHLNQSDFSKQGIISYKSARHYFVQAGWKKNLPWGTLEPKLLAKSDVASTQIDFQIQSEIQNRLIAGLNYRLSDAISPMIGIKFTGSTYSIKCLYAFDITTSQLRNYSKGTHEVSLHFCFSKPKFTERYTNPRHLGNYDFGPKGKW
jgi:type IX secretion system PorP/SprF family membrane protein